MFEEDEFDEDLGDIEEPEEKTPAISAKTPTSAAGEQITVYFQSTIGPGEKKQKLLVNTGNNIGAIKQTVGNMFALNPSDFHLSYGGVTMDETNPLTDYNVKDGDTVLLIPASTAG
ncbi:MAG: ubiquitin-like domain-containing protein [Candidatus Helarchaeota archaeon]